MLGFLWFLGGFGMGMAYTTTMLAVRNGFPIKGG
jgi:hypothetical protein